MSDFTEMYRTPADERRERQEWEQDQRNEAKRIGATRMKLAGCDPAPYWLPEGWVYRKRCVRCDALMEEFDIPVWEASLKNRWCDACVATHVRRLWFQKWKLENLKEEVR